MEKPTTFRVFVSSTFRDLEAERNVLQERAFPELRQLCLEHGARFQPIDLRWGVSEEAGLDQQAMNICLSEIERCREVTPRPNFIVLLGNRHGWLALPAQIPADELETIRERIEAGDDRELLDTWYVRDDNAVPPEFYLRPREKGGPYESFEAWEPVERRLHAILVAAVKGTDLQDDPRFVASATEQEILAGALGIGGDEGHAFAFIREMDGEHPDPATALEGDSILDFVDPDQARLALLKERLAAELPVTTYAVRWDAEHGLPTTDHLEDLARDVREALERAILAQLEQPTEASRPSGLVQRIQEHPSMDAEGLAHRDFAEERSRIFIGREDALGAIAAYLSDGEPQPLVVEGEGGTGKSALLAEALRRAEHDRPDAAVVFRFIGATPDSAEGRPLLRGICEELARRGLGEAPVPSDYQELVSDLRERLASASGEHPLIVFLDSLDQLSASQGARGLAWLPTPLPEGVRMVVSTRPEDTLETLVRRGARVEELGPMPAADGRELLLRWLEEAQRTLRPAQEDEVLRAFEASEGNPLYLRLAFEEARRWKSTADKETLATDVQGIVAGNTFERLASEDNHGEPLVSHALGYLAASRYGLAEDELLDVLSRDPEVYGWFLRGAQHIPFDLRALSRDYRGTEEWPAEWLEGIRTDGTKLPELSAFLEVVVPRRDGPRLPVVLWSRLAFDLRPYLTERGAEEAVLISFFHRELGDVSGARYLAGGRAARFHGKLADYFRPELDEEDRPRWAEASLHALGELPYHLAEAGEDRWEDLHGTLTDFGFLETKASRVGVQRGTAEDGTEVVTYTGVYLLQDDFDLALRAMSGGEEMDRPRVIVTATDFGDGYVIRCPHCNTAHTFDRECETCEEVHDLEEWRGNEQTCPNDECKGPLKVNPFVVGGPRQAQATAPEQPTTAVPPTMEPAAAPDDLLKRPPRRPSGD